MKIAIFHNLPPGGAKRVLYEEMKRLFQKHPLFLFELESTNETFLDVRSFCRKVSRFPFRPENNLPGFLGRLARDWQNFFVLRRLHKKIAFEIDKSGFDLCLVHPDCLTQAPFLLRYLSTPSIYFCEELLRIGYEKELVFNEEVNFLKKGYEELSRYWRKRIDRDNARAAGKILVGSEYMKEKVSGAYGKKAAVCPLGVDAHVFKNTAKKRKSKVLFIGGNEKLSGVKLAREISQAVAKEGIGFKQVVFSKEFTDFDLACEYSSSLVTLCTSFNEPFGLVALESMACETPVLALDEGGYRETVLDCRTGFLLKRNSDDFVRKVLLLARDSGLRGKVGREGRKHILKNWTWEKHVGYLIENIKRR